MRFSLYIIFTFITGITLAQNNVPDIYIQLDKAYTEEDYQKILNLKNEALAQLEPRQDSLLEETYFLIGDAYYMLGDLENAASFFEKELILKDKRGMVNTVGYGDILYNLMLVYEELGQYKKAQKLSSQLLERDEKKFGKSSEQYFYSTVHHIDILIKLNQYEEAKNVISQAIKSLDPENEFYPRLLSKEADLHSILGNYTRAEKKFIESLSLVEDLYGPQSPVYASISSNLALMYNAQARYPRAEELLTHSLKVLKDHPQEVSNESYISTLNNLALVHLSLSQQEKALNELEEVLQHDKQLYGENHPYIAMTLTTMGTAYNDLGEHDKAEAAVKKALKISEEQAGKNSFSYAINANNLGSIYRYSGQPEKAVPLHEESVKILEELLGKEDPHYIKHIYNLGLAYFAVGNKKAEKQLKTSLNTRKKVFGTQHPSYAESAEKLSYWYWFNKDAKNTESYFDEVFSNYYNQINAYFPALSEEEKANLFFNKFKRTFDSFYNYGVTNHEKNPLLLDKMLNHQLNTKALIMYATGKVRESIMNSGDSSLINQYEEWLAIKEQLSQLYSGQNPGTETKIDSLVKIAESVEKDLGRKSASFTRTYLKKKTDWKDIQKSLKDGEAVIEIIRFKDFDPAAGGKFNDQVHYAALMFTNKDQHPTLIKIPDGKLLEERYINNYRNAIKFKIKDEHSYKKLWSPIGQHLNGISKIYFSPDGVYNQVSIFSLYNPQTGNYLVDEIDIRVLTNSKDLLSSDIQQDNENEAYLIGYPNYNIYLDKNDSSQTRGGALRGNTRGGTTRELTRGLTRGMRAGLLRYMRGEEGITMLPGTKTEVENINQLYENTDVKKKVVLDDLATEQYVKEINNPRTLHIATHGFFLPDVETDIRGEMNKYVENPLLRSGLILAGAGDFLLFGEVIDSTGQDGILTAYEAMNLNLEDTELVVLSACETGLGEIKNGEGVYGLQRAFLIAGAENVIMSMWSVDDDATQELMSTFYKEWLQTNNKQLAFRRAQQKLKEKYPDPFYWGAFVMVGI
ncbi:MAG: CHAT domain-containing protein [Candidatus Cyclobacteriaceae bacterium M2_1C_046]